MAAGGGLVYSSPLHNGMELQDMGSIGLTSGSWWETNSSTWQEGVFYTLCGAYSLIAAVTLVCDRNGISYISYIIPYISFGLNLSCFLIMCLSLVHGIWFLIDIVTFYMDWLVSCCFSWCTGMTPLCKMFLSLEISIFFSILSLNDNSSSLGISIFFLSCH